MSRPLDPLVEPEKIIQLYNTDAEQAILGSLLTYNDNIYKIHEIIDETHFYEPVHADIYKSIKEKIFKGEIATPVTLKGAYKDDPRIQGGWGNGAVYLVRLTGIVTEIINLTSYARVILDCAKRRKAMDIISTLQAKINNHEVNIEESVIEAQQGLSVIEDVSTDGNSVHNLHDIVDKVLQDINDIKLGKKQINLIPTGLNKIDEILIGFRGSELIIIGARPSMGKTALALNFTYNCAKSIANQGKQVVFFSLEMSDEQLTQRVISLQTDISSTNMRSANISDTEFKIMYDSKKQLPKNVLIDCTGGINIDTLVARCKKLKRKANVGIIIIDYMQLIRSNKRDKRMEINDISGKLKKLSMDLDVPVVVLSQLSRAVESRTNKMPVLSDLRESGDIEQDADIVMFICREEYYLERDKPPPSDFDARIAWAKKMEIVKGKAVISVAKFRHGAVGQVIVRFEGKTGKFSDI